jgi:hypothetical protein
MELLHPKTESEVSEDTDDTQRDVKNIPDELRYNPYKYMLDHYEKVFPNIGRKVFSVLSFLPISLIMPKFTINGRRIRMHVNLLWLSPPGFLKSTISREFSNITYNPLLTKSMSNARIYNDLYKRPKGKYNTLIVEDIAVWFLDESKIKILEGVSGEEESISHETMRNIKEGTNKHVDVVCFCSGTCENITNKRIKEGILRRFTPIIITLTKEEHLEVIRKQNDGLNKEAIGFSSEDITSLYGEFLSIQTGSHKLIQPITGYIFPPNIIEEAHKIFSPMGIYLHEKFSVNTATENEQFFRFMACSAFLNIFRKHKENKIVDNKLVIDEIDLFIAKELITREIQTKTLIYNCIDKFDVDGIRTREQLKKWTESRKKDGKKDLSSEAKFVLSSIVKK